MNVLKLTSALTLALALAACAPSNEGTSGMTADPGANAPGADADTAALAPADEFLARLAQHCGQAFAGRIVANEPPTSEPDAFEGRELIMHVRGCDDPTRELQVPFHVGENHSRTWILTRTDSGLRLKHDHRLEDGTDDPTTMYGGDTTDAGTAQRQAFPVDQESIDMFNAGDGLSPSVTNVWAMEIEPGQRFLYELSRPGGRLFQVEFDLTQPVALPPTPWGYQDIGPEG